MEFFLNDEAIAWDSKPPYLATLGVLAPGRYRFVARASDTNGNSTTTPTLNFRVLAPEETEPHPILTNGTLSVTYFRFTDGTVNYSLARSTNLTAWTTFTPADLTLTNFGDIEIRRATDPLPLSTEGKRFLRVSAGSP